MPSLTDPSGSPGPITRDMLFELMVLARDTSFPDAQIHAICTTVTQDNVGDSVELLRRLHASQDTSLVVATKPSPVQSVVSYESKHHHRPLVRTSSQPGAVICADTFYKLCRDDRAKLDHLIKFCPFTLAFRKCPQSDECQLIHICWVRSDTSSLVTTTHSCPGRPMHARRHLHVLPPGSLHLRLSPQRNALLSIQKTGRKTAQMLPQP